MVHGPQCPCCAGTDVAHQIGQPCYAEQLQAQWDEERRAQEEEEQRRYEEAMEEEGETPAPPLPRGGGDAGDITLEDIPF